MVPETETTKTCPVCRASATFKLLHYHDTYHVVCAECGEFKISGSWKASLDHMDDLDDRAAKLAEAKGRAKPGEVPFIGPDIL
jgi:hypothetical protein